MILWNGCKCSPNSAKVYVKEVRRMAVKIEIENRRLKLIELVNQGVCRSDLAIRLNISMRTLDRDLVAIRKEMKNSLSKVEAYEIFGDLEERSRLRIRSLWKIVLNKDEPAQVKINAINSLRKEDDKLIKRAQLLGIIPKEPPINGNVINTQNKNHVNVYQVLRAIREKERKMGLTPEEALEKHRNERQF